MRKWTTIMLTAILVAVFLGVLMPVAPVSAGTWDPSLGWDFEAHSHTHANYGTLTLDEIRAEEAAVNAAFTAHGYPVPQHMAYPYGGYSGFAEQGVAEYRKSGRMVWGFYLKYPVTNWYEVKAAQLKRTTAWNRIKGWIEDTIKDKGLLNIFTHDVSASPSQYGCTPEKLAQVLDYLIQKQNAGQLQIVTMAQAYDIWSTATTNPKPTVVVSFDDANESDFTTVYPMFKTRGIKGTSYITTSFVGDTPGTGSLTWAQIAQMRAGT